MDVIKGSDEIARAGSYYVRVQAMARKHQIPLAREIDEHDGPQSYYVELVEDCLPVATCRLYELEPGSVMLGRIVVLPEYRGQGLGRAVVAAAEDYARELGYSTSVLEARSGKEGFYQRLGYEATGADPVAGETFTTLRMEKPLA